MHILMGIYILGVILFLFSAFTNGKDDPEDSFLRSIGVSGLTAVFWPFALIMAIGFLVYYAIVGD